MKCFEHDAEYSAGYTVSGYTVAAGGALLRVLPIQPTEVVG